MSTKGEDMNILQKATEILVLSGYAVKSDPHLDRAKYLLYAKVKGYVLIAPFADTLEGRQQADAIEDWLVWEWAKLWHKDSARAINSTEKGKAKPNHQWRLDRIKWCLDELIKEQK